MKETNIEQLSVKVWKNQFNTTHCSKRSAVYVLFLVLPGKGRSEYSFLFPMVKMDQERRVIVEDKVAPFFSGHGVLISFTVRTFITYS